MKMLCRGEKGFKRLEEPREEVLEAGISFLQRCQENKSPSMYIADSETHADDGGTFDKDWERALDTPYIFDSSSQEVLTEKKEKCGSDEVKCGTEHSFDSLSLVKSTLRLTIFDKEDYARKLETAFLSDKNEKESVKFERCRRNATWEEDPLERRGLKLLVKSYCTIRALDYTFLV